MRFTANTLFAATLAFSAAQVGLAAPMPQNNSNGLGSLLSGIPFIGNLMGGGAGAAAGAANTTGGAPANPLTTIENHLPAPGSGIEGLLSSGQILGDHMKFVMNPPSALEAIPEAQNSPPREIHRQAHAALVPASAKPSSA
ncbi:hypothetical protein NOR_05864 [Metarhizium rileyi]|uniref:Uncharacterized protein n=1 Tax=Metarhizium rileyi (strain RCEF 4871) TaxID=1649241 RepID=A0A162JCL1_METRR|nr:hypothetical protein NOR_05864 [Metarhizium rileyi RCEF 4871]